ncbi:MAG: AAA family ATPase, partial [Pseudomonadota bacterium]
SKQKYYNESMSKLKKRIPYGISNFKNLILNNYLFIDKTQFIETLEEQVDFAVFLRPRRFGKSLFISSLWYYYDEYYSDIWQDIFGKLSIGKHPTVLRSQYKILFLEFSGIVTDSIDNIYRDFVTGLKFSLKSFIQRYDYSESSLELLLSYNDPENLMKAFFDITQDARIYILIDEYDHFANGILASDFILFKEIIGKGGFVRSFYETIKTATQKGIVERLFMTGVTPITLDSMTSGFNIVENISNRKEFNELAGFTLNESKQVLAHLFQACPELPPEQLIQDITHFYNGYYFAIDAKNSIYNANLLMYFVKNFDEELCKYPIKMLDSNVASDYTIIMQLFHIGNKENNYQVLSELIYNGEVTATLKDKFDFANMGNDGFDFDEFVTLLFAMGFITIKEKVFNKITFVIPNYVIKHLYFNYFQKEIEQRNQLTFNTRALEESLFELAISNNILPFTQELQKIIHILSNRDIQNFSEKHLQTLILTMLNISDFYFIKSEMEVNKKYPDIMLLQRNPFEVNYQYLFELKFCKKKNNDWEQNKKEGIEQIQGYLKLDDIKRLENLKSYLIISNGDELDMVLVKL